MEPCATAPELHDAPTTGAWKAPELNLEHERLQNLRAAHRIGIRDPENLAQHLLCELLKAIERGPKDVKFFPKRRKDRTSTAYKAQAKREEAVASVPTEVLEAHPDSTCDLEGYYRREEVAFLLAHLTDKDRTLLRLHHGNGVELEVLADPDGPNFGTIPALKVRLFRLRRAVKARARTLFGSDEKARNQLGLDEG